MTRGFYKHGIAYPDSRVHGANMEPIWGRQDPGGPHVGPMNLVIWVGLVLIMRNAAIESRTD